MRNSLGANKYVFSLLSLLSGAALVLAFSPIHWFFLGFLCPAALLAIWLNANKRAAFFYGFLFGFGFFSVGVSWVFISIHHYGNANIPMSLLITALLILVMSAYPALMGYVFKRFFKKASPALLCLVIFPALWVGAEWLRAWLFSGFPWLLLGYSQTDFVLKNIAPILSVYGVSLLSALFAGFLVWFFQSKLFLNRLIAVISVTGICFVTWLFGFIHWTQPVGQPIQVSLIQGNIPLEMKWDSTYLKNITRIYQNETEKHWQSPIILWPEAAIPATTQQVSDFLSAIDKKALKHQTAIIFGIPTYNPYSQDYFNSIKVIGNGEGLYNKRHLVPFGEYTPLISIFKPLMEKLHIPMSGFTPGRYQQSLLKADQLKIAPFICYEIIFPQEVLRFSRGSNLIVTVSDDSWFGDSFASPQQLQMAQMRAIETARPILYATNNGITAIINPHGQITQTLPQDKRATLTADVQPVEGATLAMRWHNLLIGGLVLLMLLFGYLLQSRSR